MNYYDNFFVGVQNNIATLYTAKKVKRLKNIGARPILMRSLPLCTLTVKKSNNTTTNTNINFLVNIAVYAISFKII